MLASCCYALTNRLAPAPEPAPSLGRANCNKVPQQVRNKRTISILVILTRDKNSLNRPGYFYRSIMAHSPYQLRKKEVIMKLLFIANLFAQARAPKETQDFETAYAFSELLKMGR